MVRKRIDIAGLVQGVGFRPFVRNLACDMDLTGWVVNDSSGVTLEVQGRAVCVDRFLRRLESELPPLAAVVRLQVTDIPCRDETGFAIRASRVDAGGATSVPAEIAPCDRDRTASTR